MEYADKATENRLVMAVKEAAARIDYNSCEDPEGVLAECLMKQGLGQKFAKTATAALNKSYSVYYLTNHTDEDRDKDFPLLDDTKVKMKMVSESEPLKINEKPSEHEATITVSHLSLPKSASVKPERTRKQFSSREEYVKHLVDAMDKAASCYDNYRRDTDAALEYFFEMSKRASDHKDSHDLYTVDALYKQDIPVVTDILNCIGHTKKASDNKAMLGKGIMEFKPIVQDNATSREIVGLAKMAMAIAHAQDEVEFLQKESKELMECLDSVVSAFDNDVFSGRMDKKAANDEVTVGDAITNLGGTLGGGLAGAILGPVAAVPSAVSSVAGMADQTAKQLDAVTDRESYSQALDADFIKEQKRMNDLDAWAEVASDPMLARYTITELYPVTMKILHNYQGLSRPDSTARLIDLVAQAKAQGDRFGTAFHAAEIKNMSELAKARGNMLGDSVAERLRSAVSGDVGLTERVDMNAQLNMLKGLSEAAAQTGQAAGRLGENFVQGTIKSIKQQFDPEYRKKKLDREFQKAINKYRKSHMDEEVEEAQAQQKYKADKTKRDREQWYEARKDEQRRTAEAEATKEQREEAKKEVAKALAGDAKALALLAADKNAENTLINAWINDPELVTDPKNRELIMAIPQAAKSPELVKEYAKHNPLRAYMINHPKEFGNLFSRDVALGALEQDPIRNTVNAARSMYEQGAAKKK